MFHPGNHLWFKKFNLGIAAAILTLSLGILVVSTVIHIYLVKDSLTKEIFSLSQTNNDTNASRLAMLTDQLFSLSMQLDRYPDSIRFFNTSEVDYYLEYLVLSKLREIASIYPVVDAIQLYNMRSRRMIDTGSGCFFLETYEDQALIAMLEEPADRHILFVSRPGSGGADLVTLVYYSGSLKDKVLQYAVIIDLKEEMFYRTINIDTSANSLQYILNEAGIVLSHTSKERIREDFSDDEIIRKIIASPMDGGREYLSVDGEQQLVFWEKIPNLNWLLVYSTNMTQLLHETTRIQSKMLIISGILFIIAILFTAVTSNILYKPIQELLQKINPEGVKDSQLSDIELLSISYENISKSQETLLLQNQEHLALLQKNLLRRVFLTGIDHQELEQELRRFNLNEIGDNYVILVALSEGQSPLEVSRLFREIATSIMLSLNRRTPDEAVIRQQLRAILEVHPELTFSISDVVQDNMGIQEAYRQAAFYLKHRIVFGSGCIVDRPMIEHVQETASPLPGERERGLIQAFKARNRADFNLQLQQLFSHCHSMMYHAIEKTIFRIGQGCIRELETLYPSRDFDDHMSEVWRGVDRVEDMGSWFLELFDLYYTYYSEAKLIASASNVNKQKVSKAIDHIQVHYMDTTLSLTVLSDLVGLSPNYFNSLFKQVTGLSLPNYINQYRFSIAKQFLRETDEKISNVAKRTGFSNINYFHCKFKKDMGMTPLEYRTTNAVNSSVKVDAVPQVDAVLKGEPER